VPHKYALEASFVPTHVNKLILIVRYKYKHIIPCVYTSTRYTLLYTKV
jgi:hypothetical protein